LKRFGLPSGESALADRADTRLITVNVSIGTRVLLGNDAIIQPGAALRGFVVIGDGAEIRAGAIVENSVVLPGTIVDTNQHIVDRIVTPL
jgi:NDP-sugar pyrophosphorylase family protein